MRHNTSREHRKNAVYPKNEEWGRKGERKKTGGAAAKKTRKSKKKVKTTNELAVLYVLEYAACVCVCFEKRWRDAARRKHGRQGRKTQPDTWALWSNRPPDSHDGLCPPPPNCAMRQRTPRATNFYDASG